jgi:hypothetical protein
MRCRPAIATVACAPLILAAPLMSCTGTTGYRLVAFSAVAEGPADARPGEPYAFTSGAFRVSLSRAILHVGAIYLDESRPTAGAAQGTCTLPGTYVGEVRGGRDVDMRDPRPQPFPVEGDGSTIPAAIGQVWLTALDVNATSEQALPPTILPDVLEIAGKATKGDQTFPFTGAISIAKSTASTSASSALPGSNPVCEQRIVREIPAGITLSANGTLVLRVDPKALFTNVDFSALPQVPGDPTSFAFSNAEGDAPDQPSRNLYANLRASGPVYKFEWQPAAQ